MMRCISNSDNSPNGQATVLPGDRGAPVIARLEQEQLPGPLAQLLAPRIARLGYLGEFFKCCAHQPDALMDFMRWTESSKGGLPEKLVELIALTVASELENEYERHQHERLASRLGFAADWIRAVERCEPGQALLSEEEALLQAMVLDVVRTGGREAAKSFSLLVGRLGDAQAIAALMVLGRYVVHAMIVNTLGLAPPVASIFEDDVGEAE